MICDPSHICGRRDLLAKVSQKAMDLNFDGLMVEAHINPDEAWSDAKQQITPEVFGQMIEDLVLRHYDPENIPERTALEKFRPAESFHSPDIGSYFSIMAVEG